MLTLHPPAFIETESCDGPRYVRGQPSREQTGVTMTEIQNKYIAEFELPYRNIERYIKEIANNWNRLDEKQRQLVRKSFESMGMGTKIEGSVEPGSSGDIEELFTNTAASVDNIKFLRYLASNPNMNSKKFMDLLWNTSEAERKRLNLTQDKLKEIRESFYEWSVENTYVLHTNWKSGLILFILLLVIIILIIVSAVNGTNNVPVAQLAFGRRFR